MNLHLSFKFKTGKYGLQVETLGCNEKNLKIIGGLYKGKNSCIKRKMVIDGTEM